jgi:hypothetical protein
MRMRINLLRKVLVTIGSLSVLWLNSPDRAYGEPPEKVCTVANVAGAYGFYGGGTILPGNMVGLPPGTLVTIGRVELDGQGGIFLTTQTESFNGVITRNITGQGTYSVNEDCTGEIVAGSHVADAVFVDNRNEIYVIDSTSGLLTTFLYKRITTQK